MSDATDSGPAGTPSEPTTDSTGDVNPNNQAGGATPQPTGDANPNNQADDSQSSGPFMQFADQAALDAFMAKRVDRAQRNALDAAATGAGFENWQQMNDRLTAIQNAVNPDQAQTDNTEPTAPQTGPDLNMALSVAAEKGLPVQLVSRLQGANREEMLADADQLLALVNVTPTQTAPTGPGIPATPTDNQRVTFTRAQLQDPVFVRDNKDAIMQASQEGRIVDS